MFKTTLRLKCILFISIVFNLNLGAQNSKIINEFTGSLNRTLLFNKTNTEANIGAGIGAYHYFHTDLSADLNLGLEFNYTTQDKASITNVFSYTKANIKYNTYTLSIPVNIRYFFEYRRMVFIDMGTYLDLNLYGKRNGQIYPYNYQEDIYETETVNESIKVMSKLGFAIGLGGKIPLKKSDITVKLEVKICPYPIYNNEVSLYNSYFRLLFGISKN